MAGGSDLHTVDLPSRLLSSCARRVPVRGRRWLARKLWRRCPPGLWWTLALRSGATLRLPSGSIQTWTVAFTGCYDDDALELLLAHFEPGTLALDVGASLGLYTVPLAIRARQIGGHVVAFEPVPANREVIQDNLRRNELSPYVDLRAEALGDHRELIDLEVERGGMGNAAIREGVDPEDFRRRATAGGIDAAVHAEIRPLDDLDLPQLRCSVVKLDVEGCELQALRGAEGLIARDRPVIQGEFSQEWLSSRGEDICWLTGWAVRHSYGFVRLVPQRPAWWREARIRMLPADAPVGAHMMLLPLPSQTADHAGTSRSE